MQNILNQTRIMVMTRFRRCIAPLKKWRALHKLQRCRKNNTLACARLSKLVIMALLAENRTKASKNNRREIRSARRRRNVMQRHSNAFTQKPRSDKRAHKRQDAVP